VEIVSDLVNLVVLLIYNVGSVDFWWYCSKDLKKKLGFYCGKTWFVPVFKSYSATYVFLAVVFKITEIFL